ncbi:MAG: YtxH domain-containing protein [Phycisphaerae bacterium]|nr:YtxH domain-containing protein [Saprospiraceae bacterium]
MSNSKLLGAALGAAAAGAAIGILLAPQAGAETRKQIMKAARKSTVSIDELIEEGKKTWYETKGKFKMGTGIAADEMDDFMRHILQKGEKLWSQAKNKASEVANDAEGTFDTAMSNGKKSAYNIKESIS